MATTTTCLPLSEPDRPAPPIARGETELAAVAAGASAPVPLDHVVVVAIDGVRWQEIFLGVDSSLATTRTRGLAADGSAEDLTPNIHRIAQTQGMLLGDDTTKVVVSSPSTVSLPGYSELFSGRTPTCTNNDCGQTEESTLLDDWQAADPYSTLAIVSSWSRIPRAAARDTSRLLISAGRDRMQSLSQHSSDPELHSLIEKGSRASPSPGLDDYRPDAHTGKVAIRVLETLRPAFLFVGLGDTDEHAHHGDYDAYLSALKQADAVVGQLDAWLTSQRALGKGTVLVVTTDHGRSSSFRNHGYCPEAARIWMLWSGSRLRPLSKEAIKDSHLADVTPTLRRLLGLEATEERPGAGHVLTSLVGASPSSVVSEMAPIARLTRREALNR